MDSSLPRLFDIGHTLNAVSSAVLLVEDGRIHFANRAARRLLHDPGNVLIGQPLSALLVGLDDGQYPSGLHEFQARCCDDTLLWVEITCDPIDDPAADMMAVTIIDTSENRRQIASYYTQEQLLQAVVQNIPANVWAIDKYGVFTFVGGGINQYARQIVGQSIYEQYADIPDFLDETRRVLQGEVITRERTWSGAIFDTHYTPLRDIDGEFIGAVGVGFDITVLKMALEALTQSEEQYRRLIEQAFEAILVFGADQPTLVNESACRLLGYKRRDFQSFELFELIHPDDLPDILKVRDGVPNGIRGLAEFRVRHQDGHWVTVEGSGVQLDDGRLQIVLRDISDRKRAEQAAQEQQQLRAELEKEQAVNKLKTQLMRRIAHEFRTPLATMHSASDILTRYAMKLTPAEQQERLVLIQSEIKRLTLMLDDIAEAVRTSFAGLAFQPQPVALDRLCELLIDDLRLKRAADYELVFNVSGSSHLIHGDEKMLETVIMNLLANALKYSPLKSRVELTLDSTNDQIILQVRDHGIGIPPDDLPHIFEPFYRGSNFGQISGIGLGLTIVRDGVEAHNGKIEVSSAPGQGTTFTIQLPRGYRS